MKLVTPPFKGKNKGHYSAGVISHGMLFISGQLSLDPYTREVCKGDVRAHTRQALANVDRVLKEAGATRDQVVYCRIYTPCAANWDDINAEYAEFFGDHRPGRIIVATNDLHFGCLVEIEAIAELEP
jgi:2-iminobutanoate/2-iminopropanoate deaminase